MISMMANIPANTMNAMAMTNKKKRLFKKCLIIDNQDSQDNQDVGDVVLYDEHNTIIPPKKEVSQQKKRKTKKVGLQNSGKMALFLQLAQPNEQLGPDKVLKVLRKPKPHKQLGRRKQIRGRPDALKPFVVTRLLCY